MHLKIKLGEDNYVTANVYKDDTASTVADRVFRHANLQEVPNEKEKKRLLAQYIEQRINSHIVQLQESLVKELKEIKKN